MESNIPFSYRSDLHNFMAHVFHSLLIVENIKGLRCEIFIIANIFSMQPKLSNHRAHYLEWLTT